MIKGSSGLGQFQASYGDIFWRGISSGLDSVSGADMQEGIRLGFISLDPRERETGLAEVILHSEGNFRIGRSRGSRGLGISRVGVIDPVGSFV